MTNKKTSKSKKDPKLAEDQVSFSIEPGTKIQITVEAGTLTDGKIPINIHMLKAADQAQGENDPQAISSINTTAPNSESKDKRSKT